MSLKLSIILFICLFYSEAIGQNKVISARNQQWIQHYEQIRFSEKWYITIDGGFRWRESLSAKAQYIARTGAYYSLAEGLNIGGGLAISGIYSLESVSQFEIRPYQEVNHSMAIKRSRFLQRFRVEERFFHNKITDMHRFNWRFRYSLQFSLYLSEIGKNGHKLFFNIGDEIFLNAGEEVVTSIFDQNRFILGPAVSFPSMWQVGISYNYQFFATREAGVYLEDHVIWLTTRHTLDLIK